MPHVTYSLAPAARRALAELKHAGRLEGVSGGWAAPGSQRTFRRGTVDQLVTIRAARWDKGALVYTGREKVAARERVAVELSRDDWQDVLVAFAQAAPRMSKGRQAAILTALNTATKEA